MNRTPYPLQWPAQFARNNDPEPSNFSVSLSDAYAMVTIELSRLGATDWVVTSNASLNRDGSISSRQGYIEDTGAAVYFVLDGTEKVIAADKYIALKDNLRAIEKTINAMRGLQRWSTTGMLTAMFSGLDALPAPAAERPWHEVLQVSPDATPGQARDAYTKRMKEVHPDNGGTHEAATEVTRAMRDYRAGK